MKYNVFCLILLVFVGFSSAGFCGPAENKGNLSTKIDLQGPNSISDKANRYSTGSSCNEMDPFMNAGMNGLNNMIQGMSGYTSNINSAREQRAQQTEYAKQQMNNGSAQKD